MHPEISIVITNCDYTSSLPNLFESLLKQTMKNFEIVFIDDNSVESPHDIICQYKKKGLFIRDFYFNKRIYFKNALYEGIKKSTSDILTFIDGDDFILEPTHLERHIRIMRSSDADIVHFCAKKVDEFGNILKSKWEEQ